MKLRDNKVFWLSIGIFLSILLITVISIEDRMNKNVPADTTMLPTTVDHVTKYDLQWVRVYTDPEYGCEYLVTYTGSLSTSSTMTPRYDSTGKQVCHPTTKEN